MAKPWSGEGLTLLEKHPANKEGFWLYKQPDGSVHLRRMQPGGCPRCRMAETVRTFTSMHEALWYLGHLYPEMWDTLKEIDRGND
jgi:hypothetical protein